MVRSLSFLFLLPVFIGCAGSRTSLSPSWHPVFQNDLNGRTAYGDKSALLKAVKQGCPIRVAWGEKIDDGTTDIEFAAPDFTSLVNDSDLVVQFPASMIQTDYMNAHRALLKTDPPIAWRALMCTDGHYHQFHTDLRTGAVTRIMYLRAWMMWYVYSPGANNEPIPELTIPNGIVLDSLVRK
jgi:hypothetical protein